MVEFIRNYKKTNKDINTNNFEDVMLIKGKKDLEEFAAMYGLNADQIKKEY